MTRETKFKGLLCRRSLWVPTWRAWLLLVTLVLLAAAVFWISIHPFLAMNKPVAARVMVVEGWVPDQALEVVAGELQAGHCDRVYVVGVPIEHGAPLSEHKSFAQLGAATLVSLGAPANRVQAVPAPAVRRDRTYTAAVAFRIWLEDHDEMPDALNLATVGAHARRSHLLFCNAFPREVELGVIALPDPSYDTRRWWRYSTGVRTVVSELAGYLYARFVFSEDADTEDLIRKAQEPNSSEPD
jgi:hypothetical protein